MTSPAGTSRVKTLARHFWITFRPHFFVVSGAAGISGMALAYRDPPFWITVTIGLICFFSYGLIQALCDTFDLETDRINAPFRPLVTGELPVRTLWVVLLTLLLAVAVIFLIINPLLLVLQAIALAFSFSYNRMKRIPHAGPLWNGVIVATLPLIGAVAVSDVRSLLELPGSVYACALTFCIVYAGFVLTGYFKDVTGDARTGYRTSPVKYSPRKARWEVPLYPAAGLAGLWAIAAAEPQAWHDAPLFSSFIYVLLGSASLALFLLSVVLLFRDCSGRGAYPALVWYTRGMVIFFLTPLALLNPLFAVVGTLTFVGILEYFLKFTRGTGQA